MKTFNNVEALKLSRLTAGQQVSTKGQVTPNDGKGVTFYISDVGVESGDDIVVIANGVFAITMTGQVRFDSAPEMFNGIAWVAI